MLAIVILVVGLLGGAIRGGPPAGGRLPMPLVDGENTIPLIAAEDVLPPAVEILVGAKRSAGERIELVGQVMTPNEIAATLSRALGRRVTFESIIMIEASNGTC